MPVSKQDIKDLLSSLDLGNDGDNEGGFFTLDASVRASIMSIYTKRVWTDEQVKDFAASILDWPLGETLTVAEQELLDRDLNSLTNKEKRRRNQAANKRAELKRQEKDGNVTPEVIEAINQILGEGSKTAAADLLAYGATIAGLFSGKHWAEIMLNLHKNDRLGIYRPLDNFLQDRVTISEVLSYLKAKQGRQIAEQLYVQAHSGRWWDYLDRKAVGAELRWSNAERQIPSYREMSPSAVFDIFFGGRGVYTEEALQVFSEMELSTTQCNRLRRAKELDGDFAVLLSYARNVPDNCLPANPLNLMIDEMREFVLPYISTGPGREQWLKSCQNAARWSDLTSLDLVDLFVVPASVLKADGQIFNGCVVEVFVNKARLIENRQFMGNCIDGGDKQADMRKGTGIAVRFEDPEAVDANTRVSNAFYRLRGEWGMYSEADMGGRFNNAQNYTETLREAERCFREQVILPLNDK